MIEVSYTYRNDKLKSIRDTKQSSQQQLADKTGISLRVIQNYEQGVRNLNGAKLSTLLKLCLALDCRLEDILTDPETLELLARYEEAV